MSAGLSALLRAFVLALLSAHAWAQVNVQSVPALSSHVIDQTGTLNAAQRQALDNRLAAFEQEKGTQLVVLIVASTAPEDIASYANRVGNTWKIGRKDVGDGLLLIVAKNDRKLRIEVAKALEGAIPDLAAKRVIDQAITPHFKQGDYAGGVQSGVEQLMQLVAREGLPTPSASTQDDAEIDTGLIIFLVVAILMLALSRRRARHGHSVVSRGMHTGAWGAGSSGGWSSGGSGGGSFGSGGGGDFGGGGASGDW
ncbi:TPM domain-containing protein [Curvibacter sp. APW13]|uniref:TPM domain-containing protein n=1 Tax=Curvibacter sp. APW13 TaxID=3077236 RepID=UPI0028DD71B2|nr:TPM domain-containing protein [Curvibacter sp. APW13]MDT8989434.1 TPM domain-containing protein [Curvibacter sp. APW13]